MEMTDTERLDKLEGFLKACTGNGIAIMPLNSCTLFSIDDLADEDGSNLGEELSLGKSLREVIDNLDTPNTDFNLTIARKQNATKEVQNESYP
jgi:antirestriction protein